MGPQRLFIALEFSKDIMQALDKLLMSFKKQRLQAVRWVNSKNIHLTARFLGDTRAEQVKLIEQMLAIESKNISPFEISINGSGAFPNTKHPRVIWIGINAPASFYQLQTSIEKGCQRVGFEAEGRPFSPHLTLGRVEQPVREEEMVGISKILQDNKSIGIGSCTIKELTLFKSDLNPGGAVYTAIGRFPFSKNNI
jgi:RNA 2',3'-cyclic 3'-phosphodiesterase